MRLTMSLVAALLLLAASCSSPGGYLDVRVQRSSVVTARCVRVFVTAEGIEKSTGPMRVTAGADLRVAVYQRPDLPEAINVQAIGFSDEACTTRSVPPEQSPLTAATFRSRELTLLMERGVAADLDNDGFSPPQDCNDQDPLVKPGVTENCSDGVDNDCGGGADCADPNCHMMTCGSGSRCNALKCQEEQCADSVDGDGDGLADCADPDCDTRDCGTGAGAACQQGACNETACSDTVDNDVDGLTDCAELACDLASCGVNGQCLDAGCREPRETLCGDGTDNDADGRTDCQDSDCNQQPCSDGNRCTQGETCAGNSCAGGMAVVCNTRPGACFAATGTCSMATGQCVYAPEPTTTTCNDGDPCSVMDRCAGDGGCGSTPLVCPASPSVCFAQGVCQPALDGGCTYAVLAGAPCTDNNTCTVGDSCAADGGCQPGVASPCTPPECKVFAPGDCEPDGGCRFTDAPTNTPCAGGRCNGSGSCLPNPIPTFAPDNVIATAHYPMTGAGVFNVDCALTFRSGPDAGFVALCNGMEPPAVSIADGGAAGELAVISVPGLLITDAGSITLTGSRPVVMLVWGDAGINGSIWANSTQTRAGPGALERLTCDGRTGGQGRPSGGQNGGGGGAGFGTMGGQGGGGDSNPDAGGDAGMSVVGGDAPLLVGCPGGAGRTDNSTTPGGVGGGALQLTVFGTLAVNAPLSVSGQGGMGATASGDPGGGGGGSGGALLVQALQLLVGPDACLTSNGGGGGGGAQGGGGRNGADGATLTALPADGGAQQGSGGVGGWGGAGMIAPGNGETPTKGGGGGGGAVGRIYLKNMAGSGCSVSGTAVISPPAARTNCP